MRLPQSSQCTGLIPKLCYELQSDIRTSALACMQNYVHVVSRFKSPNTLVADFKPD